MLIVLGDDHKEHLSFLSNVDTDVVREFCKLSVEFLRKGVNPKLYQAANRTLTESHKRFQCLRSLISTEKLGVTAETVRHGVEGLMY
eukprot:m.24580 g.24580  ORF g.24580 m.24580 type:complete len:87 (+) comp28647_c0_seq1:66-326(+)